MLCEQRLPQIKEFPSIIFSEQILIVKKLSSQNISPLGKEYFAATLKYRDSLNSQYMLCRLK